MSSEEDCTCLLCGCSALTSVLYDINGNSVLIESTLIDIEDVLFSLFNKTINTNITNFICDDCKDQIVKFHIFKENAKQNFPVSFLENAVQELREFLCKFKDNKEDFVLECTETEFILRVKGTEQFLLEEDEYEPIYEETEMNSQISEEFIEETDADIVYSDMQTDDTDQIMHEEQDIPIFLKEDEEGKDAVLRVFVDNNEPEKFSCECGTSFYNEPELRHHKATKHIKRTHNLQFSCDACCITFKDEKYLRIHEKAHESFSALATHISPFCCDVCLMMFSTIEDLVSHEAWHGRNAGSVERCYIERVSAFEDHFVRIDHVIAEDEDVTYQETLFSCGHCGVKKTEHDMKLHLLFFHTTVVTCPLDNRLFEGHKQVRQFAEHIKNKHPEIFEKKVEYVCTCCNAKFATPFEKLAHMKTCDMKKFICEKHCGKRFKSEWLLKKHLNLVELGGDKRFSCSICPKHCVSKSDLQIHMRSHTNERPYQCSICNKSFKTSANRSSHMDIHREGKVHECKFCQQKFQTRPILRKHMKKHDEEYQTQCICQICKHKSYINRTHLLRHIKLSHSQPDLTIDKIDAFFQDFFLSKES